MIMLPREVVEQALDAWARGCPPDCRDGMTDSGGVHPWGEAALIKCPSCQAVGALRAALEQSQGEQEPVTLKPFNTWSSNEGDSWHDFPTDAQIIEDVFGGETPVVGTEYEVSAGWHCVTATYRITWVSEDGDCEAECISHKQENSAPQPDPDPYLYYDPENGDTWTQEAINDGCHPPDGLIALYTKETK